MDPTTNLQLPKVNCSA